MTAESALKSWLMDVGRRFHVSVAEAHLWIDGIKDEARAASQERAMPTDEERMAFKGQER